MEKILLREQKKKQGRRELMDAWKGYICHRIIFLGVLGVRP